MSNNYRTTVRGGHGYNSAWVVGVCLWLSGYGRAIACLLIAAGIFSMAERRAVRGMRP